MRENYAPRVKAAAKDGAIGDEVNVRCPCGSGKWIRHCCGQ